MKYIQKEYNYQIRCIDCGKTFTPRVRGQAHKKLCLECYRKYGVKLLKPCKIMKKIETDLKNGLISEYSEFEYEILLEKV